MNKLACLIPLALALAACGNTNEPAAPAASTPQPATPAAAPAPADQPEQPTPPQAANDLLGAKLDGILAGDWRSAANKARDQYRHPKQTLEFFGIKPGDTVIEITPGGGWYTEILAPLMKGNGTYIAAVAKPTRPDGEAATDKAKLEQRFAADAERYGEAKTVEFDGKAPVLGEPNSADVVVTFRNVHNWAVGGTAEAKFKAFFDVLKPGGVLGVTDHRAAPDADFGKIKDSGYLPQDMVVKFATDAGFRLVESSEINANPKDTKDYEKGVWTLPPTLQLGDKDKDKYLAIGESDRMTLKFVKPGADTIFRQPDQAQKH
ncbi:class I SAM-dependent methyltransferase [Dokdonella fugitiva]|uniref:class I SAM-dependent methyltransferase n=1 Tax=Dokdonella fugitiva TaxID=328517 RepID=UPI0017D3D088|nr:methyltransferase [Dokdonella fugitiva]MBA8882752.1 putative methyltransferase [Dokdonella fugitiva]